MIDTVDDVFTMLRIIADTRDSLRTCRDSDEAFAHAEILCTYQQRVERAIRDAFADAARFRWLASHGGCPFAETDPVWDDPAEFRRQVDERIERDREQAKAPRT